MPATARLGPVPLPLERVASTAFDGIIARVRNAERREDERRERERVDAERATIEAERVAADDHRRRTVAKLFAAIAEERHYLAKQNGSPVVGSSLLARFGLTPADITGEAERKQIALLAERQATEISKIAIHVERSPEDLVRHGDGWLLADSAPADVRALAAAWRQDVTMQRALGRAAAKAAAAAPRRPVQPQPEQPGAGWRRARALREQAMAKSDTAERLDNAGLAQPGNRVERPGKDHAAGSLPPASRFPGLPGSGIGG